MSGVDFLNCYSNSLENVLMKVADILKTDATRAASIQIGRWHHLTLTKNPAQSGRSPRSELHFHMCWDLQRWDVPGVDYRKGQISIGWLNCQVSSVMLRTAPHTTLMDNAAPWYYSKERWLEARPLPFLHMPRIINEQTRWLQSS